MSEAERAAPIFAALGDTTRLALVTKLAEGTPQSIAKLAAHIPHTRQAVSKHLRVLERAGLVSNIRVGRETHYALDPARVAEVTAYLAQVSHQWDEALARLRALVDGKG